MTTGPISAARAFRRGLAIAVLLLSAATFCSSALLGPQSARASGASNHAYDSSVASTTTSTNVASATAGRGLEISGSVGSVRVTPQSFSATEEGSGAAEAGGGGGRTFVTTPRGTTFDIPEGYEPRVADNGKGIVYQEPGAPGNAGSIRIMEPTGQYPDGYFRYYNNEGPGQPLDVNGNPGPPSATHIPENYIGPVLGWPGG